MSRKGQWGDMEWWIVLIVSLAAYRLFIRPWALSWLPSWFGSGLGELCLVVMVGMIAGGVKMMVSWGVKRAAVHR